MQKYSELHFYALFVG